ncbi:MAG: hypothetical protein JWO33_357 [Caulobacteraceae bacterium]|nr:hypothetical protein [Caulobacteraceae bacterium]
MELSITAVLAVVCLAAAVFCGWRGAQPPDPNRGPRMIPYRGVMLLAATLLVVLIVRVADQLGLMR